MHHRLFRDDTLGPALDGQTGKMRAVFGIGTHRDNIWPLLSQHGLGVLVERLNPIALAKGFQPLGVAVGGNDRLHLGPVPQRLGIRGGIALVAGMIVVVEFAMDVQRRRRPVDIVDFKAVSDSGCQIVEQAHPAQADNCGAIHEQSPL